MDYLRSRRNILRDISGSGAEGMDDAEEAGVFDAGICHPGGVDVANMLLTSISMVIKKR
jgi:hypothetical protein